MVYPHLFVNLLVPLFLVFYLVSFTIGFLSKGCGSDWIR